MRINFSNLKWHIDEVFTFSTIASLWAFKEQSVKIADIVYFGPDFMFLNSPFITQRWLGSFVSVTWPPHYRMRDFLAYRRYVALFSCLSTSPSPPVGKTKASLRGNWCTTKPEWIISVFIWIIQGKKQP